MPVFFISDVQLGLGDRQAERQKEDRLLAFLQGILPQAEEVCILGDLFDFWFEYDTVIPKGFHRTLTALQAFTDRGIPVHYIAGNHDFWMDDFFQIELGVRLYWYPVELTL
jgi:UDP-2,3-diacylglucosamine hydrolase